ncbi:carbohydrate ABC transporter permease [Spirillospora sp. CA-294931]|uniref:carbohydrate ABC transporter permease n=1 Tax=Spirillospora sp. CA-294931 TaxID=3240042 RepID=UPI003D94AD9A
MAFTRQAAARRRRALLAFTYLVPAIAMYVAFAIVPLLYTAWLSFFDWDGITPGTWTGLSNYAEVVQNPELRGALVHAAVFVVFYSILPIAIGLVLAGLLGRGARRGWGAIRTIIFLPQVVPLVAVGIAWRWMYADDGTVNQVLRAVGLGSVARAWLGDFTLALPAVGLVGTWVMTGLCTVFFLAGMQKIDVSLFEAARLDGAGAVREFLSLIVPLLRQEIAVAMTITVIAALASFDVVFATTGGGPGTQTTVPGVLIYRLAFTEGQVGTACAMATVLSALIFAVVICINRLAREKP